MVPDSIPTKRVRARGGIGESEIDGSKIICISVFVYTVQIVFASLPNVTFCMLVQRLCASFMIVFESLLMFMFVVV